MWGPFPTRKPKNNFSSFLGFQRDFFSKKSLWRGLGQRPNSYHKKFSHSRIQRLWLFD
jgi:hypothetical protein